MPDKGPPARPRAAARRIADISFPCLVCFRIHSYTFLRSKSGKMLQDKSELWGKTQIPGSKSRTNPKSQGDPRTGWGRLVPRAFSRKRALVGTSRPHPVLVAF